MMGKAVFVLGAFALVIFFAVMQFDLIVNKTGTEGQALDTDPQQVDAIPLYDQPRPVNPVQFKDATGKPLGIDVWQGKVVLLNIWATWCFPCREEMPTLDRLQQQLGGAYFEVAALSIDQAGAPKVQKFYDQIGIKNLKIYVDQSMSASTRLGIYGIPATLLLSPDGKELGRMVGPAIWDSPEMISFLESVITQQFEER